MHQLTETKEGLETISIVSAITTIYQEIAHMRMNQIRRNVFKTREFLEGLAFVYRSAKKSYLLRIGGFNRKLMAKENISFIKRNKKTTVVFISANEHFYGGLILDVWKNVLKYMMKNKADLLILGKIGKQLAENTKPQIPFKYLSLDDDRNVASEIKNVIENIKHYERIIVFHGKFITSLMQKPVGNDISGGIFEGKSDEATKDYLFEPSPKAVLEFFETEIIAALFNQAVLEHRLAKYASRMIAMYKANENIKSERKKLEARQKKLIHGVINRKQLETFSGFKLWTQRAKKI